MTPALLLRICLGLAGLFSVEAAVNAAEFALAVSPPRFELQVKPGERLRQILEISNASRDATALTAKTADWRIEPDDSVNFQDDLQPGSCRPWVALERRELSITSGRPFRFRFEVSVPADAPVGECRFAILLEGQEQLGSAVGGPPIPFSARLGVVVYLMIGNAAPDLAVTGSAVRSINGKLTPVVLVRNSGNAHGRLSGFLSGTDSAGRALEFAPSSMPILPGETRAIALNATRPGDTDTVVQPQLPVTIKGTLEWGKGQTAKLEQRFAQ
jgi:hypothetical protein